MLCRRRQRGLQPVRQQRVVVALRGAPVQPGLRGVRLPPVRVDGVRRQRDGRHADARLRVVQRKLNGLLSRVESDQGDGAVGRLEGYRVELRLARHERLQAQPVVRARREVGGETAAIVVGQREDRGLAATLSELRDLHARASVEAHGGAARGHLGDALAAADMVQLVAAGHSPRREHLVGQVRAGPHLELGRVGIGVEVDTHAAVLEAVAGGRDVRAGHHEGVRGVEAPLLHAEVVARLEDERLTIHNVSGRHGRQLTLHRVVQPDPPRSLRDEA
mmetsp:Transcript_15677/g.37117  ORF Transcript_15677/g.37117 Transcript_15677/m.37117 type:complete len:276 (-) Transcript_15677:1346-2173(-)